MLSALRGEDGPGKRRKTVIEETEGRTGSGTMSVRTRLDLPSEGEWFGFGFQLI